MERFLYVNDKNLWMISATMTTRNVLDIVVARHHEHGSHKPINWALLSANGGEPVPYLVLVLVCTAVSPFLTSEQ